MDRKRAGRRERVDYPVIRFQPARVAALTVGGAYVADSAAGAGGAKMVNWDVVAKNFDEVSAATRAGWKRITG